MFTRIQKRCSDRNKNHQTTTTVIMASVIGKRRISHYEYRPCQIRPKCDCQAPRRSSPTACAYSRFFFTTWKSSNVTSSQQFQHQYEVNGGEVKGVWVFHRHGDRTPGAPLCEGKEKIENEASFWETKLLPAKLMTDLSTKFPFDRHPSWGDTHLDSKRYPFGALTFLGAAQMHRVGEKFYYRYGGPHCSTSSTTRSLSFLTDWDLNVYSTNYLRTITSARSFLDGLLYGKSNPLFHHLFTDLYKYGARLPNSFVYPRQNLLASPRHHLHHDDDVYHPIQSTTDCSTATDCSSTWNTTNSNTQGNTILIRIRAKASDPLNAFDRNYQLMMPLINDVVNQQSFQQRDAMASSLAKRLIEDLPGLQTQGVKFGGPSGINWVHAFDHFVCRSSHGKKLSTHLSLDEDTPPTTTNNTRSNKVLPGSSSNSSSSSSDTLFQDDEDPMQEFFDPTMEHLTWRFRQWFTSPPLLAEFAGPPLREVISHAKLIASKPSLRDSTTEGTNENRKPFVIYSCHDVSILSLLYAIQANAVYSDEGAKEETAYWPPYASTLVFELVDLVSEDGSKTPFVRILLNGEAAPARIRGIQSNLIPLHDLDQLVEDMIQAGGRELSVPQ